MRIRQTALALVAVAAAGGMASTGATGSPGGTLRLCTAPSLTASMNHIAGSDGAGQTGYRLTLRNSGSYQCTLGNHPGLRLLRANGHPLPTHVVPSGRSQAVVIAAGKSVSARLRFSPDVPGRGEPGRGPCEPRASKVRVILNETGSVSVVGAVKPPTSVCEHGAIRESPLH